MVESGATLNLNKLLENRIPILSKWIVNYGNYNMPKFLQGVMVGDTELYKNGQRVIIKDLFCLDMKNNMAYSRSGEEFKLVGDGQRMILIDEKDIQEVERLGFEEFSDEIDEEI